MNSQNDNNNHHSDLLTISEVAHLLRVDTTTVRRWVNIGAMEAIILPHTGTHKAYRVKRSTVDTILRGGIHVQ